MKVCLKTYASNVGLVQLVHLCSLARASTVCYRHHMYPFVQIVIVKSSLQTADVQTDHSQCWKHILEDGIFFVASVSVAVVS